MDHTPMADFPKRIVNFLSSFTLAFVVLILLGVLTFVGTLEQQHMSLYDVQIKYFESFVLIYKVGGTVPIPLLGGYLLLTILSVNILVGGVVRLRKGSSTYGILVGHIGIVLLLLSSFIEHQYSKKGMVRVLEGATVSSFQSTEEWEVSVRAVKKSGGSREYIVPEKHFDGLDGGGSTTYTHPDLPFKLVLTGYAHNSEPRPVRKEEAGLGIDADGFVLEALEDVGQGNVINVPGLTATVQAIGGGKTRRAILWGGENAAWAFDNGTTQYQIHLRRRTWELPFSIRLKRFVHKTHAGTSMAKEFSSYVTKIEDGKVRDIHITMNEPLRHDGVTLYQSGWGPQNAPPGARMYSDFSVVANPTDRVPIIACFVIAFGMLWHFGRRLMLHLKGESRRRVQRQRKGESA